MVYCLRPVWNLPLAAITLSLSSQWFEFQVPPDTVSKNRPHGLNTLATCVFTSPIVKFKWPAATRLPLYHKSEHRSADDGSKHKHTI